MKILPLSFDIFCVPSIEILKIRHTCPENRYSLKLEAVIRSERSVSLFSSFMKRERSLKTICERNRAPSPNTEKNSAAKHTLSTPPVYRISFFKKL